MKQKEFILVGEAMGLFIAQEELPLEKVNTWKSAVAGAELNVAIGLARLEHPVSYLTAVGNDPFGKMIEDILEKNGISKSLVVTDSTHPTGFMLKGKVSHGDPPIQYFRKGSAAASLDMETVRSHLQNREHYILHMTGIFPALSEKALETTEYLMRRAHESGMMVTFDPNLRPQLWKNTSHMVSCINHLCQYADVFLPGVKEGEILCGYTSPVDIANYYLEKGIKTVVVKTGAKGAFAATKSESFQEPTFHAEKIVDTVGAGDGFAVGVISGLAEGLPLRECVRRGNAIGTIQIMSEGDNTGLPTRKELELFLQTTSQED